MDNLIDALKQLPEVRLRLIDLAWQVARDGGTIDLEQLLQMSKEIDEAVDEAKAYSETTRKAVACLMNMARSKH